MTDAATALLVPMRIEALVVGAGNDDSAGSGLADCLQWTDLTPDYTALELSFRTGPELVSGGNPLQEADRTLGPGVHLHFRLPRAFTRGRESRDGRMRFDPFPNRWLVQRFASGTERHYRAWLVESDVEDPDGIAWPSFPRSPGETLSVTRIGRKRSLPIKGGGTQENEPFLTAVGPGDPLFAAHYPECRSAIGLHDALEDLGEVHPQDGVSLAYLVTGWFAPERCDLLAAAQLVEDRNALANWLRERGLGLASDENAAMPGRLLCHGLVRGVRWRGADRTYLDHLPGSTDALARDLAIGLGGTGGEALGAILVDGAVEQDLLAALQEDLLKGDITADALRIELHARRFDGLEGGTRWSIVPVPDHAASAPDSGGAAQTTPRLPDALAIALARLEEAQERCDDLTRTITSLRRKAFDLWCLWQRDEPGQSEPDALTQARKVLDEALADRDRAINDPAAGTLSLERRLVGELLRFPKTTADGSPELGPNGKPVLAWHLSRSTDRPFHVPTEPSVAIAHPMAGANTPATPQCASCRLRSELLTAPDEQDPARELTGGTLAGFDDIHGALLSEAILLDAGTEGLRGRAPDRVAINDHGAETGASNPWTPIAIAWKAAWQHAPDPVAEYTVADRYRLGSDGDLSGSPAASENISEVGLRGFGLLTQSHANDLAERLRKLNAQHPLLSTLRNRPVALQRLTGFNAALSMHRHGPQVPPIDYTAEGRAGHPIAEDLDWGTDTPSASVDRHARAFLPVRDGRLRLDQLNIVDSFGQTVVLALKDIGKPDMLRVADSASAIRAEPAPAVATPLRPRLTQPARSRFEPATTDGPSASGWVIPNLLERALVLYRADGSLAGALQRILGQVAGSAEPTGYAFATASEAQDDADVPLPPPEDAVDDFRDFVLSLKPDDCQTLERMIDAARARTDARVPEEVPGASVLLGRPLALVPALMSIELRGPAMERPSLSPDAGGTDGFEEVRWPVRFGDERARDDGLVGVFRAGDPGRFDGSTASFHPAWRPGRDADAGSGRFAEQNFTVGCTAPVEVLLLMDPHAHVSATTGVLPRARLDLPPGDPGHTLRGHDVFFQSAPIIGHAAVPEVPRPSDDYGEWSWAHRPRVTAVEPAQLTEATVRAGAIDRPAMVTEGWLRLAVGVRIASFRFAAEPRSTAAGRTLTLAWNVQGADRILIEITVDDGDTHVLTGLDTETEDHVVEVPQGGTADLRLRAFAGAVEVSRALRIG